ncbi:MAG: hypothetical protein J5486_08630 [Bacteroidaceae bacterium]|nr:hypothetical protein [Bacteroidaceae bacterium]
MNKYLFSFALALTAFTSAWADDFNYLTITSFNTESSVALNEVRRITFNGTEMLVTTTDGTTENVALSTLSSLSFTSTATAIRNLNTENCQSLQLQSDRVVVAGKGLLKLYNGSGVLVRQIFVDSSRSELNLEGLPHGIYIARLGTQSLKIAH